MGYYDIPNLYKEQDILNFKECYALEKIHGTSAHISYKDGQVSFFSGGAKHEDFIKLFNADDLAVKLADIAPPGASVSIYGEAYGGKMQGMSKTYGPKLLFVTFDVRIPYWLSVPRAENFCRRLDLDFVHYVKIPTTLSIIDAERDADSIQAIKNGMGAGHIREGIVLRSLEEYTNNHGGRIIAKHKRDVFRETATPRKVKDNLKILTEARDITLEWVTEERMNHILTTGVIEEDISHTGQVIVAMLEDIKKEAVGEIVLTKEAEKLIGRETALMFKRRLRSGLYDRTKSN